MSVDVVKEAIEDIQNAGVSIKGPCGAFGIANLVAHRLGLGVLFKPHPTENNCIIDQVGYAADIVMNRDGDIWDILYDGGGANQPTWNGKESVDASWYRKPLEDYPIPFIEKVPPVKDNPLPPVPPLNDNPIGQSIQNLSDKIDANKQSTDKNDLNTSEFLHEELNDIKRKQDRTLGGNVFGQRVKLTPEE